MATYKTYGAGAAGNGYTWTGLNTLNQFGSLAYVSEPIYATHVSAYWGGYDGTAYGFHCIWHGNSANNYNLIVRSGTVSAAKGSISSGGQSWYTASIPETFLNPGWYFVGVWCNPNYRRIWTQFTQGTYNTSEYKKTSTGTEPTAFTPWETDSGGVVAAYITGEPAGRLWVNDGGTWKKGNVHINDGGTWKKSKGVWVNDAGTWKRSK
jgi:hypothetical protein